MPRRLADALRRALFQLGKCGMVGGGRWGGSSLFLGWGSIVFFEGGPPSFLEDLLWRVPLC